MALPQLDPEQRAAALEKARRSRRIRAEIKQMLKSGEVSLGDVLDRSDDDAIARMRVVEVLEALPAIGKVKSEAIMDEVGIAAGRRVQGLGPRQREALLAWFAA
jgi:hypothetical protein